jgi:hypothetical protein
VISTTGFALGTQLTLALGMRPGLRHTGRAPDFSPGQRSNFNRQHHRDDGQRQQRNRHWSFLGFSPRQISQIRASRAGIATTRAATVTRSTDPILSMPPAAPANVVDMRSS